MSRYLFILKDIQNIINKYLLPKINVVWFNKSLCLYQLYNCCLHVRLSLDTTYSDNIKYVNKKYRGWYLVYI
jgi:hypothetical protein